MFRLGNQKPIPRLFILNLLTTESANAHLYLYTGIAYSQQDAFMKALTAMQRTDPDLYMIGQAGGGFKIVSNKEITLTQLQSAFRLEIDKEDIHKQDNADEYMQRLEFELQPISERSRLIKEIIDDENSEEALQAHIGELEDFEIAYIREQISTKE